MDFATLASGFVRTVRGRRAQAMVSRRLRRKSNVLRSWEAGRRFPTAAEFFRLCAACGLQPRSAIQQFLRPGEPWIARADFTRPDDVAKFLDHLRGRASIVDVARRADRSRYSVSRWLCGESQPRLPDFLALIEATTFRTLDFIASFVDPTAIPEIAADWRRLEASREAASRKPWSHAVLRALELETYRAGAEHIAGAIAQQLGISAAEEESCLELLARAGQIELHDGLWVPRRVDTVDTRMNPDSGRQLVRWWSQVALDRMASSRDGLFSYNLFSISDKDYRRLQELHRAYFREMRALVSESTEPTRVAVVNMQLFALDQR